MQRDSAVRAAQITTLQERLLRESGDERVSVCGAEITAEVNCCLRAEF